MFVTKTLYRIHKYIKQRENKRIQTNKKQHHQHGKSAAQRVRQKVWPERREGLVPPYLASGSHRALEALEQGTC